VELVPKNSGWLGYICSNCQNYVAFLFRRRHIQPSTVLDPKWLKIRRSDLLLISEDILALDCQTEQQFFALNAVQVIAEEEESSFRSAHFGENQALLLLKPDPSDYIGYLVWSINSHAVLNQIYVVPRERRNGRATAAVRYWVERYADGVNDIFHVESPNEKTRGVLLKLGYGKKALRV
jgi:hypothetical protein